MLAMLKLGTVPTNRLSKLRPCDKRKYRIFLKSAIESKQAEDVAAPGGRIWDLTAEEKADQNRTYFRASDTRSISKAFKSTTREQSGIVRVLPTEKDE